MQFSQNTSNLRDGKVEIRIQYLKILTIEEKTSKFFPVLGCMFPIVTNKNFSVIMGYSIGKLMQFLPIKSFNNLYCIVLFLIIIFLETLRAHSGYDADRDYPTYSPSILENNVPTRSKSVMSDFVPFYVYENIKKVTESERDNTWLKDELAPFSNTKSKSTENLPIRDEDEFDPMRHEDQDEIGDGEKVFDKYNMKLEKENILREQIIKELLLENAEIVGKLKTNSPELFYTNSAASKRRSFPGNDLSEESVKTPSSGGSSLVEDSEEFIIPELPRGRILIINILNTWGDRHYVGLNGIEIFGDDGRIVQVATVRRIIFVWCIVVV